MRLIAALLLTAVLTLPAFAEPVCKVVDGDTFHFCDGMKVRLDGIDAPERGEPFYWESRRELAVLLQGKTLEVTNCRTDDTGSRKACGVLVNGKDIQGELVRQGLAWDWPKYSKGRYHAQEQEAKAAKRGIWSDSSIDTGHWHTRRRF